MYTTIMGFTLSCLTLVSANVTTTSSDYLITILMNDTTNYNSTKGRTAKELITPSNNDTTDPQQSSCKIQNLDITDVHFTSNEYMIVNAFFKTIHVTESTVTLTNGTQVCFNRSDSLKARIMATCKMFEFEADEYQLLENGSVSCYGDIYEPGMYLMHGNVLKVCAEPEGMGPVLPSEKSTRIGTVGCFISITALVIHLSIFCMVPSLRNVPGCNLAALSVAFLMGCTFYLIGQINEVKGHFCVATAILQMYFLLASFFCLNTMAVDVWRTFRMSTRHLAVYSEEDKKKRMVYYMTYAWGAPLIFTIGAVIAEHATWAPVWIKPRFGVQDICWIRNDKALGVFFAGPAFAIIVANAVLFIASSAMIRGNAFKEAKLDLMLFARLACMMGVTWLVSVVAVATGSVLLWNMSDVLNSLQGLVLLVLFTSSKRVVRKIRENFGWTEATSSSDTTTKRSHASEAV